ncbi:MAG: hypothetical protein NT079_01110 [Candidatus Omnitrophica bacterium]|nr:hypothetical protein [Candidatus Omnitrophota bacterium]
MFRKIFFISFFIITFSLLYPTQRASAQSTESAVRETDVLGRQQKEKIEKELREQPEEKPKIEIPESAEIKGEKKFFVKKITLIGYESLPLEKFSPIIGKYENKELTLSDLKTLSKELEQVYLDNDIIAAVIVPPQEIADGTATLQVVEAKFGELNILDHKYFRKNNLRYYWKILAGSIISYDKVSKSIQLMNKNPDREVKAALQAGKEPKTTDVVLTAKTRFPAHFTASFDNAGSISTGKGRQGYGIKHNNFLGLSF